MGFAFVVDFSATKPVILPSAPEFRLDFIEAILVFYTEHPGTRGSEDSSKGTGIDVAPEPEVIQMTLEVTRSS